jgi:chemotaxis-related protein WspB
MVFKIEDDRYALPAQEIVEVLPLIALKQLPQAPRGVVGLLNYRGQPIPVLDLSLLATGRAAAPRVSTRLLIIRAESTDARASGVKLLGLIVERATETASKSPADFVAPGVDCPTARFLGKVAPDARGFIQHIDLAQLLNAELCAALALLAAPGVPA